MRLIDADVLDDAMYHEAFENDSSYDERNPMARWDSGLWIRYKMFENAIADAPTIEPKRGEWIPCSERMPSECDEFLITWTASVTNEPLLAFAEYEPDAFLVSGGKWYLEDDMREFKDVDVIAWMPLPKPWKGADDE